MMQRQISIVGAPSSIGIRPYDDGRLRRLDLAPGALRECGLRERLNARDLGDVLPPRYVDLVRPPGKARNERGVVDYSRALGQQVARAAEDNAFVLVLGGDCSIVLGSLLGVQRATRTGLIYIDAHSDFATPEESTTGSVAAMCLALAVGRGDTPLARLNGEKPLALPQDVVLLGRRDEADGPWYGQGALRESPILDITHNAVRARGPADRARAAIERLVQPDVAGFFIHLDADILDPSVMPAVDSPEPGGLTIDEVADLVTPLVRHPNALGLQLTIYDPGLDPDGSCAARLADLLERVC